MVPLFFFYDKKEVGHRCTGCQCYCTGLWCRIMDKVIFFASVFISPSLLWIDWLRMELKILQWFYQLISQGRFSPFSLIHNSYISLKLLKYLLKISGLPYPTHPLCVPGRSFNFLSSRSYVACPPRYVTRHIHSLWRQFDSHLAASCWH